MPRMMRFESPGFLVHIMSRGIDGKRIFGNEDDREEILRRVTQGISRCGYRCLAWCLMQNHYHLLCRTNENAMSSLMRPLNGGYARWFNKKYDRRGYLFQDRYKSVLCQDMDYAKQLIQYIHLNPLRSGEVKSLAELGGWAWCGHGYLLRAGDANGRGFQDRNEALRWFGTTPENALDSYLAFLAQGIDHQSPEKSGALSPVGDVEVSGSLKGWPAVIGDPEFAQTAMKKHEVARWRVHRKADYEAVLAGVAQEVCRQFSIEPTLLLRRGKLDSRTQARARFCQIAHYEEKIPLAVIARYLGITITPVVRLLKRDLPR